MFILLSSNRESVESCHALAGDMLRESESLEQVVMDFRYLGPPNEYGIRSQTGSFLLSRGSDKMRRLRWDGTQAARFMLPVCEKDAAR